MKKSRKVVYLEKNPPRHAAVVKPGSYGALVGACRGILFQALEEGLKVLFTEVDDDLFKLAEHAGSNREQSVFFDALRSFRLLRKPLEGAFLQSVEGAYRRFWDGESIPTADRGEGEAKELSLVEKEELEEDLAVTTLVSKTRDRCHRELLALDLRFAHMLGRGEVTTQANPVGPDLLAHAFREALSEWDAEVLARIVVYKCFDRAVMGRMRDCYEAMNLHLAENGILPELRYNTIPRRQAPSGGAGVPAGKTAGDPAAESPASESAPPQASTASEVPPLEEIWRSIRQLQAAAASLGALPAVDPNLPVLPRGEVMEALSRLQSRVPALESLPRMDFIEQQRYLLQELGGGEGDQLRARLGERDQQVIDVILMLFNQVLEDPGLPDALRALLGRLQIPVLKAAIADPRFLQDEAHPARRLLDELAAAGIGWRDDGDRSERSLYTQVKRAVDRIVHDFHDDVGLFDEVRAEFAAWRERREHARKILEERLTQSVSGEEKLTVARMEVEALLKDLRVERLPEGAATILQGPWKKLLTILWLREGADGTNWLKAVELARKIAGYLQPGARFERDALIADIPAILGGLKQGFLYISLDQKQSSALLNRLQGCFITVLRLAAPSDAQPEEVQDESPPPAAGQAPEVTKDAPPEREPDEFDRQVAQLQEGTWLRLELDPEAEESLVCKLVWRSKYTGTMVFVDGQGNKAAQMKEEELAERFRSGRASLLEEVQAPLIDRALRKMMRMLNAELGGLRRKKSTEST